MSAQQAAKNATSTGTQAFENRMEEVYLNTIVLGNPPIWEHQIGAAVCVG